MIEFLLNIWTSMNEVEFFFYAPCCALVCGLIFVICSFFGRGVKL